jgi:hypothetical protein
MDKNGPKGFCKTSGSLFHESFQEVGSTIEGSLNFSTTRKILTEPAGIKNS